ncbi:N-acetyltransferase [Desulfobacter hydrogenophilus]|uniref:N-acetyltransferase n=1 Tax=Desulfobacter hydrogenophilus TaxID=2291 RepID=A0A328FEV9_9BACT|nr:GNAT family N-acetyltransferase [Desulfobacter hydrogenophilus]NDY72504.1 GNAT family N-acetyltransferase [Desulfobacter hydrogenophilus]QBH14165.1 N-acetyltransferase [Desulfobacter hydrogenophilus]RAM01547.1 N-acetyltransferase [Desulfobacter hydrogenophilus]
MRTEKLKGLEIKLVHTVPVEEFQALYQDAGWWQDEYKISDAFLRRIPEKSALFAGAFLKKKLIGMGRALSDLCSDAYIQDVVVLSDYQKLGIGSMIVTFLIQELKKREVDWIGLIGEPGTRAFYENLGFRQMRDYIPFKLE